MQRRPTVTLWGLVLALVVFGAATASEAARAGTYLVPAGGTVQAVRVIDVDGDKRPDLVALVRTADGVEELVVLRTPRTPVKRSLYPADHITRIPCTGALADAGAVGVGRFGPQGAVRFRFFGPRQVIDVLPSGTPEAPSPRLARGTLLGRSTGRPLAFWDGIADLDGDGIDETWVPAAEGDGPIRVFGGTAASDRLLTIGATNHGSSNGIHRLARHAYVPNLFPADLDGNGTRELVALRETDLVGWSLAAPAKDGEALAPTYRLHLPFLAVDATQKDEALRTPRIQIEDVDGDGIADLLVTLITGLRTNLTSIRTILFHYPGPFRDKTTGALVKPRARIDTQSIVLHPTFVDLDGDGDRDYVGDSIRGTMLDLIKRLMGQDPKITLVGFRFDKGKGTFEDTPYFTTEREYASQQALSNAFGRSAWLTGDFDADGHADLLDLGNLTSVQILQGTLQPSGSPGDPLIFGTALLPTIPVKDGLKAGARIADLNADGRADAVLWGTDRLYVVLSKAGSR